jgi:arylsulfatase A-like enzyme
MRITRMPRKRFSVLCAASWLGIAFSVAATGGAAAAKPPNVILVLTDDQGFGDMGFAGNPIVRTPHLDAMASRSVTLHNFYVSPACTPTRASLMTGRYHFRTRAIDTFLGRAMMDPGEVTVAELLHRAGYATGIFGKWHLGDTYPLRAMDKGFEETLVHRGGGIGQPSDPPGGEGKYTDPILFRNGQQMAMQGYCTDVYFTAGMRWAEREARQGRPFFLYLPTNAPHDPYGDVPLDKLEYYQKQTITADRYPETAGHPLPKTLNADNLARVYAMIENIDDNLGRLFAWLDHEQLTDNTLVLFLTDNGPWTWGYNAGLRDHKTSPYEGGIRSPLLAHWPRQFQPGICSDRISAHIDLMPTILDVCGVPVPQGLKLDGRSLLPLWKREPTNWPDRTLFFQMHRGDVPVRYHNCAARTQGWKLVHATGFGTETFPGELKLELFDMAADPYETRDVSAGHPDVVADLQRRYDQWFDDVGNTRPDNYAPLRILLGTPHENPVVLTRQDWRGIVPGKKFNGHWLVNVTEAANYDVTLRFKPIPQPATVHFELGSVKSAALIREGSETMLFKNVSLPAGPGQLEAYLAANNQTIGVMFVEVLRRQDRKTGTSQ